MNKNNIITVSIVTILLIGVFYILNKEEKQEKIIKPTITKKIKEEILYIEEEKKEPIVIQKVKIPTSPIPIIVDKNHSNIAKIPQIEKNKLKTIIKSTSKNNRYIISLQSNKILKKIKATNTKYIPFEGIIKDENFKDKFSIVLRKDYIDNNDIELNISITSLKDDKITKCNGYFLKNTNLNYIYTLRIEIFNDYTACHIYDKKKIPTFVKYEKLELKDLKKNSELEQ